jgi:hypothetical protein
MGDLYGISAVPSAGCGPVPMTDFPCLVWSVARSGEARYRLGDPPSRWRSPVSRKMAPASWHAVIASLNRRTSHSSMPRLVRVVPSPWPSLGVRKVGSGVLRGAPVCSGIPIPGERSCSTRFLRPWAAFFVGHASPDAVVLPGVQREHQALPADRAVGADRFRLRDLVQGGTRRGDRKNSSGSASRQAAIRRQPWSGIVIISALNGRGEVIMFRV